MSNCIQIPGTLSLELLELYALSREELVKIEILIMQTENNQ